MDADLFPLLDAWPITPGELVAREIATADGTPALQLRLDMGVMQMHLHGRPDGSTPYGQASVLDHLKSLAASEVDAVAARPATPPSGDEDADEAGPVTGPLWAELDREMIQYYHRRLCLLAVGSAALGSGEADRARQRFLAAAQDAEHTLACMDFIAEHGPDEEFISEREQYRPYVLWHRGFALAQAALAREEVAAAIDTLKDTEAQIRAVYEDAEAEDEDVEQDAQLQSIRQLIDHLRNEHNVGLTLREQLQAAVDAEQYELAARLRDQLRAAGDLRLPGGGA